MTHFGRVKIEIVFKCIFTCDDHFQMEQPLSDSSMAAQDSMEATSPASVAATSLGQVDSSAMDRQRRRSSVKMLKIIHC